MRYIYSFVLLLLLSCQSEQAKQDDWCCAELRVIHLAPTASPMRVEIDYFNTRVLLSDSLIYAQAAPAFEHLRIDATVPLNERGWPQYRVSATPLWNRSLQTPTIKSLQLDRGMPYTLVLSDTGLAPTWVKLIDRAPPVGLADTNSYYIRLVNLSNASGAVLTLSNRSTEPARPYSSSLWLRLNAGQQRLEVRDAQQNILWTESDTRILMPQRVYQAYFNRDTLLLVSDRFR